jgi:hypothetical protein
MWNTILTMVIARVIENILNKPGASDAVKAKLVEAKTPAEVRAIMTEEIATAASEVIGSAVTPEIITDLAAAKTSDAVQAVLDKPEHKANLLTFIGDAVGGILNAIFGKKK